MTTISGTIFEIIQILSLMFAILTVIFICKRAFLNKQWLFDLPMLILMAHGIFYYVILFGIRYEIFPKFEGGLVFTPWSTVLRFHGYATLLIMAITNYIRERKKIWKF